VNPESGLQVMSDLVFVMVVIASFVVLAVIARGVEKL
jgi:hypothetical protein